MPLEDAWTSGWLEGPLAHTASATRAAKAWFQEPRDRAPDRLVKVLPSRAVHAAQVRHLIRALGRLYLRQHRPWSAVAAGVPAICSCFVSPLTIPGRACRCQEKCCLSPGKHKHAHAHEHEHEHEHRRRRRQPRRALIRVLSTSQRPLKASGKYRSAGPPAARSRHHSARSNAGPTAAVGRWV